MSEASIYKKGIYAILCREHIIYIGMTEANFAIRWRYHLEDSFGECKEQRELHSFIRNHKKDIRFQELLDSEQIRNIGITTSQAEKILIGWYNPIFNKQSVLFKTRSAPLYSVDQVINKSEKIWKRESIF